MTGQVTTDDTRLDLEGLAIYASPEPRHYVHTPSPAAEADQRARVRRRRAARRCVPLADGRRDPQGPATDAPDAEWFARWSA